MATSGSSNSNSTVLGGYNFGFYDNSTQLAGSHFKDPVLVSAIVVNGICVFSFAVLAIVAWWMKGKRERGRRVFAFLYGLLVAMFLAYARTMADEIVHEYELDVPNIYLLLPVVKQVLSNGTDTALLFVVYSVIRNRFRYTKTEKFAYGRVPFIHIGIYVGMLLFGVADAALFSYAQVFTVSHDTEDPSVIKISNWYRNIHLSYVTVYCVVILEMFTCAGFIFKQSTIEPSRISKYLVAIITPFLVIRSVSNLAFTLIYVYLAHDEHKSTGVIIAVLLGITSVAVYTGLVIVGFDEDWNMDGIVSEILLDQARSGLPDATEQPKQPEERVYIVST